MFISLTGLAIKFTIIVLAIRKCLRDDGNDRTENLPDHTENRRAD